MSKIDLDNWLVEKNQALSDRGVTINRVSETSRGQYELEIALNNLDTIRAIEDGYTKTTTSIHPEDKELAKKLIRSRYETAAVRNRPDLMRGDIKSLSYFDPNRASPQDIYKKSLELYNSSHGGIYGSVVNVLTNFAAKGFRNDIDDPEIAKFFDIWGYSTKFPQLVQRIFFDLIRLGIVRTYKVVGRYIPQINYVGPVSKTEMFENAFFEISSIYKDAGYTYNNLSKSQMKDVDEKIAKLLEKLPKEHAARKIKWSKDFIPIGYTILNPTKINLKGHFLFGGSVLTLSDPTLKEYFEIEDSQLSEEEKRFRRQLPSEFKEAALQGKEIPLNPELVGAVDYRKMDYERWPMPRGLRAFDFLAQKEALYRADMSTVDGINNYILKVTIGSDKHPITDTTQLEIVADMFDTPQKAFTIFWNHTLQIEKVTFPEIADILGNEKYAQVEKDISGSLAIVRALVDGNLDTNSTAASIEFAVKSIIGEVEYLRSLVEGWIYEEYRDIAEGMGFDKFPKIRFDDMALRDELKMMALVQGMVDRRIMSYQSGIEKLGFDYPTILSELKEEKQLVLDGTIGVIGSPYNPKAAPQLSQEKNIPPQIQPTQRTPRGTPSEGRPVKGQGKSKDTLKTAASISIVDIEDENMLIRGIIDKGSFVAYDKEEANISEKESNSYVILTDNSESLERFNAESEDFAIKKAKAHAIMNPGNNIYLLKGVGNVGRNTFFELKKVILIEEDFGG